MSAKEAAHYGVVNKVVPGVELMQTVRDWARRIAEVPSSALQGVKEILREIEDQSIRRAFETIRGRGDGLPFYAASLKSDDTREGLAAFIAERKSTFERECR